MKRIHFEMITALIVFAWTISNVMFIRKEDAVYTFLPIMIGFIIQFLGTLLIAAAEPSSEV